MGNRSACFFCILQCFCILKLSGQVYWDGEGGDAEWATAANWSGNMVPAPGQSVILDNSLVSGNYIVHLPPGNTAVTIASLTISPGNADSIVLVLPASNTAIPAFTTTGPGYGLLIGDRAVFRNASGAASGAPVDIADSIRINNGGRYIQNTQRSHAANVNVLSRAPGTERGIFEFDIPDASTTLPLTNRVFGRLEFSADAAGSSVTYTAAGLGPLTVNNDIVIQEGVILSLNLDDTLMVYGDWLQQGNINLGNADRLLVTHVYGNVMLGDSATMSETGTAKPELWLSGNALQQVSSTGSISDSISVFINNDIGVELTAPLSIPGLLSLRKGIVSTSTVNLLTLLPGAILEADSLNTACYINGPVRKEGLSATEYFLFPVGDQVLRWVCLKNATGNFTVTFIKNNPQLLATAYSAGIDHISGIEYWSVEPDNSPVPQASLELSFHDPNSGGVTDLSDLRVAAFNGTAWDDAGNMAVSGTAGAQGSVTGSFQPGVVYYALASSNAMTNPLPVKLEYWTAQPKANGILFKWAYNDRNVEKYIIETAVDTQLFKPVREVIATPFKINYEELLPVLQEDYYRLKVIMYDREVYHSKIISCKQGQGLIGKPVIKHNRIELPVERGVAGYVHYRILDHSGRCIAQQRYVLRPGEAIVGIDIENLPAGTYYLQWIRAGSEPGIYHFFRQ